MARFLCADSRVGYDKFTDRAVGFFKTGAFSRAMIGRSRRTAPTVSRSPTLTAIHRNNFVGCPPCDDVLVAGRIGHDRRFLQQFAAGWPGHIACSLVGSGADRRS
jgi:hypothetical protein